MTQSRWHSKADALVEGWRRVFVGETPPVSAVVLALSVAQHETRCGDAWPGEYNWGATTLRSLTAAERDVLAKAGIAPTVGHGHNERSAAAQAALVAAGLAPANGVIHADSTTDAKGQHPYFVYFFRGTDDADGARYFLQLLAGKGKPAKAVLDDPKGTEHGLAAAMYARGYFWGFKPHGKYTAKDGTERDGNAENIAAYAGALQRITPTIRAALKDWTPKDPIPAIGEEDYEGPGEGTSRPQPDPIDLATAAGAQDALNKLGCGRPPLTVDGNFATKSIAALGFYQGGNLRVDVSELLDVTGKLDAPTLAAIRRDLIAAGYSVKS